MRIYKLEIRIEEPVLVTESTVGNILKHKGDYLSGMTLRGAMLYRAFKEQDSSVAKEMRDPKLIFHPAYPISDSGITEYAHPFIYECKLCDEKIAEDYLEKVKKNPLQLKGVVPPYSCEREKHFFSMKSLGGSLVARKDGEYVRFGMDYTRIEAVGISKRFKTSEVGMLYNYVCLTPGLRFQGYIVDLNDDRFQQLGYHEDGEYELAIGRGGSRGLSHATVKVVEERDFQRSFRDKVSKKLKEELKKGAFLFLKAKAPIYGLSMLNDEFHARSYLEIPPLIFKNEWITGVERISGFSLKTGYPKAAIKAAKPGSVYLYKPPEEKSEQEIEEILIKISLVGLGPFNHLGLNLLELI
jgi:hypothetical protein